MTRRAVAVLDALPPAERPLVLRVLDLADARDLRVYLVGGPVRDHLLRRPLRDVDLMVERRGRCGAPQLARAAQGSGVRVVAHERFGTARLESGSGGVDLTTARSERYPHAGSLPQVAPGSLEEDLRRRDFSVNALAVPLSRSARRSHPAIVDPEGGVADLGARRLRILHPQSFHDDPTRALRAARLGPRLGFRLSAGSRRALSEALSARSVERVSGERLRRELEKTFLDVHLGLDPTRALELAQTWGVLHAIHAGLRLEDGPRRDLCRLRRSLRVPPWPWARLRPWVPGFALWLAGVRAQPRRGVLERLAVRGDVRQRLEAFPSWRARVGRSLSRATRRSAVERQLSGVPDEWLLALHAWLPAAVSQRVARYASEDRGRETPLSGGDLVSLGFAGRSVGQAMARLRAAQLDGELRSREQALALARTLAARKRR
jgi:tRNA nucleotidyltransferase (CCA-adding enzyme)